MPQKEPNTICKNLNCHRGSDGDRKHYYSCRFCLRSENWRSMACCPECYQEYMEQVEKARSEGRIIRQISERTDMSEDEVKSYLSTTSLSDATAQTRRELSEEITQHPDWSFAQIVDWINKE